MPYINEEEREELDEAIEIMAKAIKEFKTALVNPHNFANFLGRINYCFSRVLSIVMGDISYSKIAMVTGVLENIKQEFYRRIAANYEDKKILENGDIKEYK
jgi:aromatic ring-opening dioxygenase LigB subunit